MYIINNTDAIQIVIMTNNISRFLGTLSSKKKLNIYSTENGSCTYAPE